MQSGSKQSGCHWGDAKKYQFNRPKYRARFSSAVRSTFQTVEKLISPRYLVHSDLLLIGILYVPKMCSRSLTARSQLWHINLLIFLDFVLLPKRIGYVVWNCSFYLRSCGLNGREKDANFLFHPPSTWNCMLRSRRNTLIREIVRRPRGLFTTRM